MVQGGGRPPWGGTACLGGTRGWPEPGDNASLPRQLLNCRGPVLSAGKFCNVRPSFDQSFSDSGHPCGQGTFQALSAWPGLALASTAPHCASDAHTERFNSPCAWKVRIRAGIGTCGYRCTSS